MITFSVQKVFKGYVLEQIWIFYTILRFANKNEIFVITVFHLPDIITFQRLTPNTPNIQILNLLGLKARKTTTIYVIVFVRTCVKDT